MLTLTRKIGETIRIGDDIQIVVKEIRKNQVRIGIVAPRDVKIFREEVYQNIVDENQASTQAGPDEIDELVLEFDGEAVEANDPDPLLARKKSGGNENTGTEDD